ncbi:LADA_0B03202g1_1 [Lachancea dasiensis]|uniref:LADA_0B03202g1_1 n=1 Tax=Lachancea dasiensis TaxID=1072105 RepID=A0A1G4IT27_9SACH|nr:LADA_0B03202g1_1 [Lachancea dasiensis]
MSEEQRPHTGLKGATITGDIQELMSFSDANRTIGGYLEEEPITGNIHLGREKLPRFSSTIQVNGRVDKEFAEDAETEEDYDDTREISAADEKVIREGGEKKGKGSVVNEANETEAVKEEASYCNDDADADDDDDDDFFYGDYISTNNGTRDDTTQSLSMNASSTEVRQDVESQAPGQLSDGKEHKNQHEAIILDSSDSDTDRVRDKNIGSMKPRRRTSSGSSLSDTPRKKPRRLRSNANPGRNVAKTVQKAHIPETGGNRFSDADEDEQFFKDLAREAGRTTSTAKPDSPAAVNRVFNLKFTSILEGTVGKKVNAKVKGTHAFDEIIPVALNLILKEYNVPTELRHRYDPTKVSVYRNDVKLPNFMTCNALPVPLHDGAEIKEVSLCLVASDKEKEYEMKCEESKREDDTSFTANDLLNANSKGQEFTTGPSSDDHQFMKPGTVEILDDESEPEESCETSGTVHVVLMAKGNDKLHVNAHKDTTFDKLILHYREQKNLSAEVQISFFFDNERISPTSRVRSWDLEDEDIVEVQLS